MKNFTFIIILSLSIMFSGCATIFSRRQTIHVSSYPQGASVYAGSKYVGITPCSYKSRRAKATLTFAKDGYQTTTIATSRKTRGAVWCNLLFTGFIGMLADIPFWYKYKQTNYVVRLKSAPKPTHTAINRKATPAIPTEMPLSSSALSEIAMSNSDEELTAKTIYQKYQSAVFMIFTGNDYQISQGSGFFISKNGIGISNYHVFKGTHKGKEIIKLLSGATYKIKEVLAYSEKYDYIIFKVDGSIFDYIPITKRGFEVGDKVYAIGSPRGFENTISDGLISARREGYYIQISVPIDHGSSGGPLINEHGEVVGITSGGRDDSHANLNFARDIRAIFNTTY